LITTEVLGRSPRQFLWDDDANYRYAELSFPVAKNDDQVDALAMCGQLLDIMAPPILSNVVRVPQLPRDYVVAAELERGDAAAQLEDGMSASFDPHFAIIDADVRYFQCHPRRRHRVCSSSQEGAGVLAQRPLPA
jgi:hypothetical protein